MGRRRKAVAPGLVPDTRLAVNRSGVWEIRWVEVDEQGRSRSRSHSCRTKDRAVAEQARQAWIVAGMQVQRVTAGSVRTVRDLVDAYLQDKGFDEVSSSAGRNLRQVVAGLGDLMAAELTTERLAAFRLGRLAAVTSGTVRRELVQLKAVLAWAREAKVLPEDVKPKITLPPEGAAKTRFLSESEEEQVWAAAAARFFDTSKPFRERRIGLFVCLALETAARMEAILGLTWDRVDTTRWVIDFRDPQKAVSNKRRVPVPVSDRLLPVLSRHMLDMAMRPGGLTADGGYVLGHPGKVQKAFEAFRAGLVGVGVASFTIHDMRRTWASLRLQWGVPIEEVAGVLGDTVAVVEKHYAHFIPGYLRSAVNARPAPKGAPARVPKGPGAHWTPAPPGVPFE